MGFKSPEKIAATEAKLDKIWKESVKRELGNLRLLIDIDEREKKAKKVLNPIPKRKF